MTGSTEQTITCVNKRVASSLFCVALGACSSGEVVTTPTSADTLVASTTQIWDVQGSGATSPLNGQAVTVRGVVTGDFQDNGSPGSLGGFFLQSESPDGDAMTSDGIFVYDGPAPMTDVSEGEVASVSGTVTERFGETQIVAADVTVAGAGSVQPSDILLPVASVMQNSDGEAVADLEHVEGMLVRFPQSLAVTELYDLERYGEIQLSHDGRLVQFTNTDTPSVAGYVARQELHARQSLRLDDASKAQNVRPIRYLHPSIDPDYSVRIGDEVSFLVGNVRYSRGSGGSGTEAYRIVPMDDPQFGANNPRPAGSPAPGGNLKVASFNLLNFFANPDTGAAICGPQGASNCRGANNAGELKRQTQKTVRALQVLDADIVGLIELENQGNTGLQLIVDALNTVSSGRAWSFVDTGNVGDDAIRNAFIYDSVNVSPVGGFAIIDSAVDTRFNSSRNRPSIAQTFRDNTGGGVVTVVVNHLKSKGSSCDDAGDPNIGDGQANCNETRTFATAALANWLASDPTGSGDDDFLIIGDLNAYLEEDPVTELEQAGYSNLLRTFRGSEAYSYVFRGESGALDHALASASLLGQVTDALEWHINADEPPVLDYNLDFGRNPAWFDPTTPYRASDHDPVVIGLQLR